MKTLPAALAAHIATRSTTLATALKITRTDGTVYGFTSHDVDSDPIGGVTYLADPGLDASSVVIAANAAVGNLELTTLHDGTVFTMQDVLNGVWRNAAFELFRYNWASVADGVDTLLVGTLGEAHIKLGKVTVELRDLRQYLQQPIGEVSSKTCRVRLGSARCGIDLTGSPNAWTVSSSVTSVTSNQVFRDNTRFEAVSWFDEGEIAFTSGENSGISAKVKSYAADGTFTLALPLYGTVAAGDQYTATAGCRKRREEDCHDKFGNVLNFQGEPDRQGVDDVTQPVAADV